MNAVEIMQRAERGEEVTPAEADFVLERISAASAAIAEGTRVLGEALTRTFNEIGRALTGPASDPKETTR